MPRAFWNNRIIADALSAVVQRVEGNIYFPPSAVKREYLRPSASHTHCPWKGEASYYNVEVDGMVNEDAAWYYSAPSAAAANIKDYIAFWHGVQVEE